MNRYTENTICTRNCVCTDIPTKIRTDIHVFGISVQSVVVSDTFFGGYRCDDPERSIMVGSAECADPPGGGAGLVNAPQGVTAGRGYCRKGSIDVNGEINTM